jgi:hypothetical protein
LPLAYHQYQRPLHASGDEELPKDEASLDRLAKADLIGDQETLGEALDDRLRDPGLVWPGNDRTRGRTDICAARQQGCITNEFSLNALAKNGEGLLLGRSHWWLGCRRTFERIAEGR